MNNLVVGWDKTNLKCSLGQVLNGLINNQCRFIHYSLGINTNAICIIIKNCIQTNTIWIQSRLCKSWCIPFHRLVFFKQKYFPFKLAERQNKFFKF